MRAHSLVIRWSLGLVVILLEACFAPDYPTGIPCSELETCPPGQSCSEGICRAEPVDDDPDAGVEPPDDALQSTDATAQPLDAAPTPPDAAPVACTSVEQCNDDLACTTDACEDNFCVHRPDDSVCGDEIACTVNRCDAVLGCVAAPNDSACDDGVACTTDRCDAVQGCVAATNDNACNDGVACTTDRCDAVQGCVAATNDSACNDSIACTTDRCDAVQGCVATTNDSACNDSIACTANRCDAVQGCVATPNDSACNDGVACTTDRCNVTQGCVATPNDGACNDNIACTTNRCDATLGCRFTPNDGACNDGVGCTSDRCDAAQGCRSTPDNSLCNDSDGCTTDSCDATNGCVNADLPFCSNTCTTILIYNDSAPNTLAAQAAGALGISATVTNTDATFATAFDAGGFDLIIIDSASGNIPPGVASRLTSWVQGSGKVVFSYWNLDADAALRSLLGVNTVRELNPSPPVHADPASPVNFFTLVDVFPSPLAFGDFAGDNGDALTLAGGGFVAARFTSATSAEGAILVTQSNRVIVQGFLPHDISFANVDADADSISDGQELYRNEIRFLCAPAL